MAVGDMATVSKGLRRQRAVMVALAAEMVYQLTGSNMSSPQTAELNAGARAPTLKKWVMLTNYESAAWIIFLCILDGTLWPIVGGGLALGGMVWKYDYAIKCGLKSSAPPTEKHGTPPGKADGTSTSSPRPGRVRS
jgi:hypothetical protein